MFTNTTTLAYLPWILGIISIYYLYVGLRYYNQELKNLLKSKSHTKTNPFQFDQENTNQDDSKTEEPDYHDLPFEETSDDTFDRIEELIKRLKPAIAEAIVEQTTSQQLKANLSTILYDFADLKKSTFRPAISELILTECKDNGSTVLSEQEVEVLWGAQ